MILVRVFFLGGGNETKHISLFFFFLVFFSHSADSLEGILFAKKESEA